MLPLPKVFQYTVELIINRSRNLPPDCLPKDDGTNWLFLVIDKRQFSFVYQIEKPEIAVYSEPFTAFLAFTFPELIGNSMQINQSYSIMRAEEFIGSCKIIGSI